MSRTVALVRSIDLLWLAGAVVLLLVIRFIIAWRWQILLAEHGIRIPIWTLTRVIFISVFFGSFLPGGLGPDLVRGYEVSRSHGRVDAVAGTLLIDRIVGMWALLLVALAAAAAGGHGPGADFLWPLAVVQAGFLIFFFCGIVLFNSTRWRRITVRSSCLGRLFRRIVHLLSALSDWRSLRRIGPPVLALSILVVLLRCFVFFCLYRSMGASVSAGVFLLFIPLVFVIVMAPISVGGIGVREGALAWLFGLVGVPTEVSVSAGLSFQLLQLILSTPGVVLWWIDRSQKRAVPSA